MARTVKAFPMAYMPDALFNDIYAYLMSEGYEYIQYNNENVFKKGKGLTMGPTFIKVSFQNNAVYLEAWLKFAVLPGVYAGESGLDGLMGVAVKGPLKTRFARIESMIQQYAYNQMCDPPCKAPWEIEPPQRFCPNCGASLTPGAAFCTNCGNAV